jgi:hypothetical protein
MTTESQNLPANVVQMAQALAQSAAQAGAAAGSDAYMKFTKFGEWVYGVESTEVEEGSHWAVNPFGFLHGWTAWGNKDHGTDGQNVGEAMVPATQPMPLEGNLPSVKGEWSKCVGIQLRCTDGEDEGVQVLYKANSHGGRKAYAALLQSVVARITAGEKQCMPLVELKGDSYAHKTYGKIFNPVIEIVGWAAHDDTEPKAQASVTDTALQGPAAAPKEEPAPAEAPRRRRRRE